MEVPAVIRYSRRKLMYLVYWAPFILVYQLVNRWPMQPPRELAVTWLDEAIPFVPPLLPVYVAYLPFYWWTVARARSARGHVEKGFVPSCENRAPSRDSSGRASEHCLRRHVVSRRRGVRRAARAEGRPAARGLRAPRFVEPSRGGVSGRLGA